VQAAGTANSSAASSRRAPKRSGGLDTVAPVACNRMSDIVGNPRVAVFALSDPHLALSTPGKSMDRFGPHWVDHPRRMAEAWDACVRPEDIVAVPGDISWARDLEGARADLDWLHARPGTKVLVKGNHEHWWPASMAKLRAALPPSCVALSGDALRVGDVVVCGTRLWDVPCVSWHDLVVWQGEPISAEVSEADAAAALRVYERERARLDRALAAAAALGSSALRLALLHYPPVGPARPGPGGQLALPRNELTARFTAAGIGQVIFGHLHALDRARAAEVGGLLDGVRYHLASVDWIDFAPVRIA